MTSLMEWFAETVVLPEISDFDPMIPGLSGPPTKLQLFAALIAKNGGRAHVSGWGIHVGGGPYGMGGLTQEQALTLIAMSNFVEGWLKGTGRVEEQAMRAAVDAEHERVIKLWEEASPE